MTFWDGFWFKRGQGFSGVVVFVVAALLCVIVYCLSEASKSKK